MSQNIPPEAMPSKPMETEDPRTTRVLAIEVGYECLIDVLHEAYGQAAFGKGAERHAGGQPFDAQPMQAISQLLGSERGMAFQAIKKIREGLDLPETDRQVAELLGAINYIAGIIIYLRAQAGAATTNTLDRQRIERRLEAIRNSPQPDPNDIRAFFKGKPLV